MLVTREQCSTVVTVTIIVLHTHDTAEVDHLPQLPPTSPETDEGVTSKYRDTVQQHYQKIILLQYSTQ